MNEFDKKILKEAGESKSFTFVSDLDDIVSFDSNTVKFLLKIITGLLGIGIIGFVLIKYALELWF